MPPSKGLNHPSKRLERRAKTKETVRYFVQIPAVFCLNPRPPDHPRGRQAQKGFTRRRSASMKVLPGRDSDAFRRVKVPTWMVWG